MKIIYSILKSNLLTIVLAVMLSVSMYLVLQQYGLYLAQTEKREALNVRLKLAENQRRETSRKLQVFSQVKAFLDQSRKAGLQPRNWSTYHVNIEQPVTFETLEVILNQCNTTTHYYFNPNHLHIRTRPSSETDPARNGNPPVEGGPDEFQDGDLFVDLKGSFIVRETL